MCVLQKKLRGLVKPFMSPLLRKRGRLQTGSVFSIGFLARKEGDMPLRGEAASKNDDYSHEEIVIRRIAGLSELAMFRAVQLKMIWAH